MLYIPSPVKRCTKCNSYYLPTTDKIYRLKRYSDSQCAACRNEHRERELAYKRRHHVEHREQDIEESRQWREKKHAEDPEGFRQYVNQKANEYHARHHERSKINARKNRAKHIDKRRAEDRARHRGNPKHIADTIRWQKEHPERARENARHATARYKERQRGNVYTLTTEQWHACLDYFEHRCVYCGATPQVLCRDHFIPSIKGGAYAVDNIVPACRSCNARKNDRDAEVWLVEKLGVEQAGVILKRIHDYFAHAVMNA
jgi:hypothetical protein